MNAGISYAEAPSQALWLTPAERERAALFLQQTQSGVLGAIRGLSDAQWRFSIPERWSIAQIVEHIVFVIDRVSVHIREQLTNAPAPPERDYKLIDEIIIHQFPTRLIKFPAPPFAIPSGRFESCREALSMVATSYAGLSAFLESTLDLREHVLESFPLKALTGGKYDLMDGYQWILAAAAHTERHTKQILEIRADPQFPAN